MAIFYQGTKKTGKGLHISKPINFIVWEMEKKSQKKFSALFVVLYKIFDSLLHDFLLDKPNTNGFDYKSIKLTSNFISCTKCRTKINSSSRN